LLVLGAAALAFYVGMMYERKGPSLASGNAANDARRGAATEPTPAASAALPSPTSAGSQTVFESRRAAVDLSPASEIERMKAQTGGDPLTADDPELLYLYGRALLLIDRQQDAVRAFDLAIQKAGDNMTSRNGELKIDAMLAKVAAQVRNGDSAAANDSARSLDGVIRPQQQQTGADGGVQPTPGATP
jgi:hypothetical protein